MATSERPLRVDVVIVARNDAPTIGDVIAALPKRTIRTIIVVDNDSRDTTSRVAELAGAVVLREPHVGYGAACRRAVAHLSSLPVSPDVVIFLDGDGASDAPQLAALLEPLKNGRFDLAVGTREHAGSASPVSLRRAGKSAVGYLIHAIYRHKYSDFGSFRAIRYPALVALGMRDEDHGWRVEMQVRAVTAGLRVCEVPLSGSAPEHTHGTLPRRVYDAACESGRILYTILRHSTVR